MPNNSKKCVLTLNNAVLAKRGCATSFLQKRTFEGLHPKHTCKYK